MRNITHKLLHLSRQDIIVALLTLAWPSSIFRNMYIGVCQTFTASKFALRSKGHESANKQPFSPCKTIHTSWTSLPEKLNYIILPTQTYIWFQEFENVIVVIPQLYGTWRSPGKIFQGYVTVNVSFVLFALISMSYTLIIIFKYLISYHQNLISVFSPQQYMYSKQQMIYTETNFSLLIWS